MNRCKVCNIELESDKAKTCSPRCRKLLSRQASVTQNVSVTSKVEPSVTFRFRIRTHGKLGKIREAKYWYDVPLGAIPVYEEGWPKMPEFMNGRQYFLWWNNEFKLNDNPQTPEQNGLPEILNPYPLRDNVTYKQGGQGSRHWGAA